MTAETVVETAQIRAPSPNDRKRHQSGSAHAEMKPLKMAATEKVPVKAPVTNNGWGELFKNKQNFVEMHVC